MTTTYHTPESYRESEIRDAAFDLRHWGADRVFMSYPRDIRFAAMIRLTAHRIAQAQDVKRPTLSPKAPSKSARHLAYREIGSFHTGHRETAAERHDRKHKADMAKWWG